LKERKFSKTYWSEPPPVSEAAQTYKTPGKKGIILAQLGRNLGEIYVASRGPPARSLWTKANKRRRDLLVSTLHALQLLARGGSSEMVDPVRPLEIGQVAEALAQVGQHLTDSVHDTRQP